MATKIEGLWILDTSVAVAWFFENEEQHDAAIEVLRDVRREPNSYVVPPLFYAEVVNVLARKSNNVDWVREGLATVISFGIRTLMLAEPALLQTADWACKGLGGYDATFVALAQDLGGRWLTTDTRAARIADEHAVTLLGWTRIKNRDA